MNEYNIADILNDSYIYGIGHIPSALSLFYITKKIYDVKYPIILGKTFGVQAWFYDSIVRKNFLSQNKRKIICIEDFVGSHYNVVFCQQHLGLAAGYAVGYAFTHKKDLLLCILSDGDLMMRQTLNAIDIAFKNNLNIKFIIDYNKVQLFGKKDCITYINKYKISYKINYTLYTEIILVKTKKGFGVPVFEKNPQKWHYTILNEKLYNDLKK